MGKSGSSCIEDLFDPSLRTTVIGGRTFNPDEKADSRIYYPKPDEPEPNRV
jgi:hypothetical protein